MSDEERRTLNSRDRMMGEIAEGVGVSKPIDHSDKRILARGCDPQMAIRASKMLPPHLGNPVLVSATNDDDFLLKLQKTQWSVVFFAPGACRYDGANLPIPGTNAQTRGWNLATYKDLVRTHQGEDIPIVETTDEREIIPLLLRALNQSRR
jgi:hypothetical protein